MTIIICINVVARNQQEIEGISVWIRYGEQVKSIDSFVYLQLSKECSINRLAVGLDQPK